MTVEYKVSITCDRCGTEYQSMGARSEAASESLGKAKSPVFSLGCLIGGKSLEIEYCDLCDGCQSVLSGLVAKASKTTRKPRAPRKPSVPAKPAKP